MDYSAAMLGFKQFQLAFAAVKIGLPHILEHAPLHLEQIAHSTGVPPDRLVRFLRGLIWCDVLKLDKDGAYSLTEAGGELLDDSPLSLAEDLRFQGEFFYRAYGELHHYLLSGEIPFARAHGIGVFDALQKSPELARLYAIPMSERSSEYSAAIARHPALDQAQKIMDIGGGSGRLLIDVLKIRDQAQGVIFDLPYLREQITEMIATAALTSRCRFEAGDMFRSIPAGADAYLLKWVLHDWADQESLTILRNCASAMTKTAKLLIIERLMPQRITPSTSLMQGDLNMLCLSGGAERTLDEYRSLCSQAGLKVDASEQIETDYGFHLIEVFKR